MRFSVWVNHDSTLELRTMVGFERGAKAAAEAGSRFIGMAGKNEFVYRKGIRQIMGSAARERVRVVVKELWRRVMIQGGPNEGISVHAFKF
jgi:hypothetical protein